MQIHTENLENNVLKIILAGRMDLLGAQESYIKLTPLLTTRNRSILMDLTDISFLASLGIRTLLTISRAVSNHDGLMALYNPQPNVMEVLETSGVSSLIPVHFDHDKAMAALSARNAG